MRSISEQISLDKAYEVRHWMRTLRWSQEDLYSAVRLVGRGVGDLRALRASMLPGAHVLVPLDGYRPH